MDNGIKRDRFFDTPSFTLALGKSHKNFPANIVRTARRKIGMILAATSVSDLKMPPGNKLHALLDDRAGQWAIWINKKYRVCFSWNEQTGQAERIEVTDYH